MKLFFDECLSKRLPVQISQIYSEDYPDLKTLHLTECYEPGTPDEKWIPLLEKEKDWIVITADDGMGSNKAKLPLICAKLGITHIVMTPALHQSPYREHKQAILCLWPQFVFIPQPPKGTKISMGYKAFSGRNWPHCKIEGKSLDAWCLERKMAI